MTHCEICSSLLDLDRCPHCDGALRDRFRHLIPGEFPATAMPAQDSLDLPLQGRLRRALLSGDLRGAEQAWDLALAGLRPIGPEGRARIGEAFDAVAALKEALGKPDEARRLRQRALSARKDPTDLRRKQKLDGGEQRFEHVQRNVFDEDTDAARRNERIRAVEAELARQLELRERRERALKRAALGGLAGAATGGVLGFPFVAGGALGAGLGLAWKRR
jgi:hypothetical protein